MIPDLNNLLEAVMAGATHRASFLHGEGHWKCVAHTGLDLCRAVPDADPMIAFLFGLLHDTQRINDGTDPDHGRRAAAFARRLHERELYRLNPEQLESLTFACAAHADGLTSPDDTIVGVCWDADRLNLWRVGIKPAPRFLSTAAAREPERIARSGSLEGQRMSWEAIYAGTTLPSAGA